MENACLTAVCDIVPEVCREKSEQYEVPGFVDHTELLDSGLVDAVIVATPHYFHPPIAIDAFSRGLHVLSEKPIAVTVSAADEMIAAAKSSGLKFAVMYQMRTEPVYIAARRIIESGALGELYRTCMVMGWYRSQAYYDSGGWRATWTGEGGGVLINQAPHLLDIYAWLAGLPAEVHGQVRTRLHDIEVEDEAFAFLTYANGAHGYLYASTTEAPGINLLEIAGDKSKLRIQDGKLQFWTLDVARSEHSRSEGQMWGEPRATEHEVELPQSDSGHRAITANFADAILTGAPLIAPGPDGLNAMELINGLILSGKRGKPVSVPVERAEYDGLIDELQRTSRAKSSLREQRVTDPQHQR
jgi:predicted dehydrogenase